MRFIEAGAFMLLYLFIFTLVFFVIDAPITAMLDGFYDTEGDHSDEMDIFLPDIRTALSIFFALIIAAPIIGFIMWVFHREPDWQFRGFR